MTPVKGGETLKRKSLVIALMLILCFGTFAPMAAKMAMAFPGDEPAVVVEPSNIQNASLTIGSTFQVNVSIYNVTIDNVPLGLGSLEVHLEWNNTVLVPTSFVSYVGTRVLKVPLIYAITAGFYDSGDNIISSPPYTNATSFAFAAASGSSGWFGSNVTATITFQVLAVGSSILGMPYVAMTDFGSNDIPFYVQNGFFSNIAIAPLSASISPMSTSILLGQNVNFTSTVSGGVPPYGYQWYRNGTIVLGASSNSWDFTPAATGSYSIYMNVTDSVGNTTISGNASVTVTQLTSPIASISASSTAVYVGQAVNLSSTVSGGVPPYTYQWLLNDSLIPSATLANYTFSPISSGSYLFSMNVTDSYGNTTTSNTIAITVMPPLTAPAIYIDPSQILNVSMGPGSTFSINITVSNVTDLATCIFNLTYDPQVLTWIGFDFVQTQGEYPTAVLTGNTITGYAWICLYYLSPITVTSAPLAVLRFYVNSYGITPLTLTDTELLDQYGDPIVHNTFNGIFANIIRDVAVINVVAATNWVYQNWTDVINVTLTNFGDVTESFTASAWYDSSLIGSASVNNLAPNASTTVSIIWDTTGVIEDNYTITGTASFVPYETYFNTANNVYVDGIVQVLTTIRDVATINVQPYPQMISPIYHVPMVEVYANRIVTVNVTVANMGNLTETFTVAAYIDGNITLGTQTVTNLPPQNMTILTFYWNPTGQTPSSTALHTVSANASFMPYEYNTTNNNMTSSVKVMIKLLGDINGDGVVGLADLNLIAKAYNTRIGDPKYNPEADFNNDGFVNLVDFATLSRNYNMTY